MKKYYTLGKTSCGQYPHYHEVDIPAELEEVERLKEAVETLTTEKSWLVAQLADGWEDESYTPKEATTYVLRELKEALNQEESDR